VAANLKALTSEDFDPEICDFSPNVTLALEIFN